MKISGGNPRLSIMFNFYRPSAEKPFLKKSFEGEKAYKKLIAPLNFNILNGTHVFYLNITTEEETSDYNYQQIFNQIFQATEVTIPESLLISLDNKSILKGKIKLTGKLITIYNSQIVQAEINKSLIIKSHIENFCINESDIWGSTLIRDEIFHEDMLWELGIDFPIEMSLPIKNRSDESFAHLQNYKVEFSHILGNVVIHNAGDKKGTIDSCFIEGSYTKEVKSPTILNHDFSYKLVPLIPPKFSKEDINAFRDPSNAQRDTGEEMMETITKECFSKIRFPSLRNFYKTGTILGEFIADKIDPQGSIINDFINGKNPPGTENLDFGIHSRCTIMAAALAFLARDQGIQGITDPDYSILQNLLKNNPNEKTLRLLHRFLIISKILFARDLLPREEGIKGEIN